MSSLLTGILTKLKINTGKKEEDSKVSDPTKTTVPNQPMIFKDSATEEEPKKMWETPRMDSAWNKKSDFDAKKDSFLTYLTKSSVQKMSDATDEILRSKIGDNSGEINTPRTPLSNLDSVSGLSSPIEPKPFVFKDSIRKPDIDPPKPVDIPKDAQRSKLLSRLAEKDTIGGELKDSINTIPNEDPPIVVEPQKEHTIEIKRIYRGPTYTISKVYLDGEYFCDSLEDTDRDTNKNGTFDPDEQKIWGETAIPNGTYWVDWRMSPRFSSSFGNKYMPYIEGINGFSQVLFHHGNTEKDTHGCVLLGRNTQKGRVTESIATTKKFLEKTRPWIKDKTIVKVG